MNAQKTEGDIYTNSGYGRGIPSRPSIAQSDKLFWSTRAAKTKRRLSAANDLVLIERLKAGEQQALEILFDRYSPKLYNLAHRILRNVPDTEEVIQDVFWTAYRKAESFRGQSQFSTWLYRLTVNGALGRIRERKKDKTVDYTELLPKFREGRHHFLRPVIDWSNLPEEEYAKGELRQLLNTALDQLKPFDKAIVVLSDLEGLAYKQIAAVLRITVSTVKTRLHRARLFLRGKLTTHLGVLIGRAS